VLVTHGTFIHTAAMLVPHTFVLVTAGIAAAVRWVAARRPAWDVRQATTIFTFGAVAVALVGAAIQSAAAISQWSATRSIERQLAAPLVAIATSERVMSADPGAYNYLSGHPGVVTPSDPLPVIEDVMRAYDVRWLVLERSSIVPALSPVLTGALRPSWLSAPVAQVADSGATYAVCFETGDARCAR
jgi:hypothetical protein